MERESSSLLISRYTSYPFFNRTDLQNRHHWKGSKDLKTEETDQVTLFKSLPELRWQQQRQEYNESAQRSLINYRFFEVKYFPHFGYIYTQTWYCKKRVEKAQKEEALGKGMPRDVIIKIGIVGNFTKDDLHLLSKSTGKRTISRDQHIWEAQPIICFENELSSQSKLKKYTLCQEKACHKILFKPNNFRDDTDESVNSIIYVVQTRAQIQEAITICLEEPIHRMLEKLLTDLKTAGLNKIQKSGITAEIEAIRKQMTLENSRDLSATPVLQNEGTESVIPENIKAYLFGRPDVHSFGIWRNSSFKVLVKKTDDSELKSELTKVNPTFFETYKLEVEKRKLLDRLSNMMQGDQIMANIQNEVGNYRKGTLGGFVTKSDEEWEKYALTCNHIFPEDDEPAYNHDLENIGSC